MYLTWAVLSLYGAAYFPLALFLIRLFDRRTRLPLVLTFPLVLVALEYVRYGLAGSFVSILTGNHQHDYPGGFAWYFLGHTQHDFLELIQIADLTGVYGVCFLVAAVNALLFEVLFARRWFRAAFIGEGVELRQGKRALLLQGLAVAVLLASALAYGLWRLGQDTMTPGPRLALLQGNVPQRVRNESTSPEEEDRNKARASVAQHHVDLAALGAREKVDLIVWPETSYPGTWEEYAPGKPAPWTEKLAQDATRILGTAQLLGMTAAVLEDDGKIRSYNSAILIDKQGRLQGRYDKIHRVPFGEYIPLRDRIPWLKRLAPYDYDYEVFPGETFTRLVLAAKDGARGAAFGVVICYEGTDPAMARPYVKEGRPVDFLVNISNDGWFDGTSEHEQHLALCRFRAVECRRAVARAVNMGISAVIDSNGRVLQPVVARKGDAFLWSVPEKPASLPVSRWHEYKKVAGVLVAAIPIDSRGSLYARWGDWFAVGCGAMLILSLVAVRLRSRRGGRA
jgi:apolipoprotein N-acyltransferase